MEKTTTIKDNLQHPWTITYSQNLEKHEDKTGFVIEIKVQLNMVVSQLASCPQAQEDGIKRLVQMLASEVLSIDLMQKKIRSLSEHKLRTEFTHLMADLKVQINSRDFWQNKKEALIALVEKRSVFGQPRLSSDSLSY